MDETDRQQQRSQTNKLSKCLNFLKMTLQLLLPLSVLSLFISHLSVLMTLERKYMFLICNGIVALLFKSFTFSDSTAISTPPPEAHNHRFSKKTSQEGVKRTPPELKEAKEDEEKGYKDIPQDKEEPQQEEDFGQEVEKVGVLIPQESEEDDVDMSTEDLNRRFDEFIRKMKEELRIGARRQLITV